jgi:antitoxin component YwqK of YwqJK toxin-antitoxin module
MKFIIFTFFVLTCGNFIFAQKTLTTYYDKNKSSKKEVYQVDANGERHGSSKYYDEGGALIMEGFFQFGKQEGACTKYTKFANYSGKMQVFSKDTYVKDMLNGSSVHYSFSDDIGVYEDLKGSYKNGEAVGIWEQITPLDKYVVGEEEYEYIKGLPVFKGSMAVKKVGVNYNGTVKAPADGKFEIYYYPSNKLYYSCELKQGTYRGEEITFYPDGKVWKKKNYDENGQIFTSENYYYNGQLKSKKTIDSYVDYNQDGSPDKFMLEAKERKEFEQSKAVEQSEKDKEKRESEVEKLKLAIKMADEMSKNDGYSKAINYLQGNIYNYKNWMEDLPYGVSLPQDLEELKSAEVSLEQLKKQKQKMYDMPNIILAKHNEFEGVYLEKKKVPLLLDGQGNPTYKNSYPKGKYIYDKGEYVYQESFKSYNAVKESAKGIEIGNDIIKLLDRLILLGSSETKAIDKSLKDVITIEEIKKILELD